MAILRKLGRGKKKAADVLRYLEYAADISGIKRTWRGRIIPYEELTMAFGLPIDPIEAAEEILGLHKCYATPPNSDLVHHVLFDIDDGTVDPWQARDVVWRVNDFLRQAGLQFYQGIHTCKRNREEHPHAHIVINAIYPLTGKKVQINHSFLRMYKWASNTVLRQYRDIPLITIGAYSLPFYFHIT